MSQQITYKDSGVDLEAANLAVKSVAALAKSTFSSNVLSGIGLFGGLFKLDLKQYSNPVLVSSVDGVGTKLKIAFQMNIHKTIGEDLVNHCVNDIMTTGADPLFFLDYIGTSKLTLDRLSEIVEGMARGCKNANCALIGGETAEMPGFYAKNEYDLVGAIVGVVDHHRLLAGSNVIKGDVLIGVCSNGMHTNGFSLARSILFNCHKISVDQYVSDLGRTVGEELLRVHKSYRNAIIAVRSIKGLVGISHVTGGGIKGNTTRLLPTNLCLHINWNSWSIPPIFEFLQKLGKVSDSEMRRVFNLGIGMVFIVRKVMCSDVMNALRKSGEEPICIGEVVKSA